MMAYPQMTFEDAYNLPIPYRRWLLMRWQKHQKDLQSKSGTPAADEPLSQQQKMKYIQANKQATNFSFDPRRG